MRKFIVIGDVHADFGKLWAALRTAGCVGAQGQPTPPVQQGMFQVILMGDLAHPKSAREYAELIGQPEFNPKNPEHLAVAATRQIEGLEKLMAYQQAAPHAVHIILGNHDDVMVNLNFVLGTSGGMVHAEFDPNLGAAPCRVT
ncbi:metallophosphoesterase [Deinococcus lacus]|uniref:Metallophosphoesterase n=1 Tax=Deinococcus lacus TaxID=392561 RepID=A0ABW1YED0_9DEIO